MHNDDIDETIELLEQQIKELQIEQRKVQTKITELKAQKVRRSKPKTGFSGFQLGDRVYAKTSGTLNIRSGTVIGITGKKITYRGDCGTKTWRSPKNLTVVERNEHHEL